MGLKLSLAKQQQSVTTDGTGNVWLRVWFVRCCAFICALRHG